jgi:hypothetical protein
MGKTKLRSRTIYFSSRMSRPGYSGFNYSFSRALDVTVSVRSILKYSALVLVFVIILGSVFVLGRISAKPSQATSMQTAQLSGQMKQVSKPVDDAQTKTQAPVAKPEESADPEPADNLPPDTQVVITRPEPVVEQGEQPLPEENTIPSPVVETPCFPKHAVFDYNYTKVNFTLSNFNKDVRGDNWATITSVKLTVTNNEPCTIINPTQLKIKISPKGKGSNWWDDEVFIPETFTRIAPGGTVTDTVAVHVSYSDIYGEKELKATLFDDYDIAMSTVKKYLFIE